MSYDDDYGNRLDTYVRVFTDDAFDTPRYQTFGSAGMDLHANNDEPILIQPGDRKLIPTGLRFAIPTGVVGDIRPRSGLVLKHGITVLNSPGTIDSDYRGTVGIILHNASNERFFVNKGDRIAQIVFTKYERVILSKVDSIDELGDSERGEGGFGSTGNK